MTVEITSAQLQAWYAWAQREIPQERQQEGRTELNYLLREVTEIDLLSLKLGAWGNTPIKSQLSLAQLSRLWQQRWQALIPLQYLLGYGYWRELKLQVTPSVLIPRPETEYLIDLARDTARESQKSGIWVDLGTGSGAIAIGLAQEFPQAQIVAVDISPEALGVAQANIKAHQLEHRIQVLAGAWWQPLAHLQGKVTGVLANPPYIPTHLIEQLQPEVQAHEPHLALSSGPDGLADLRQIIEAAPNFLVSNGLLIVEIMSGQGGAAQGLLEQTQAFQPMQIIADLAGHERYGLAWRI